MTPLRTAHSVETVVALPLNSERAHTVLVDFAKGQRSRRAKRSATSEEDDSGTDFDLTDFSDDDDLVPEADELTASMELPPSQSKESGDDSLKRSMSGLRGLGLGKLLLSRSRSRSIRTPRNTTSLADPPVLVAPVATSPEPLPETLGPPEPASQSVTDSPPRLRSASEPPEEASAASRLSLDHKIIREVVREMRGLIFAKDWDITRRLQAKADLLPSDKAAVGPEGGFEACLPEPTSDLPLHRRADRQFWWNRFVSKPLVETKVCIFPVKESTSH